MHRNPPDFANAEVEFRTALMLADEFGMRPLAAHCHLGIAKLATSTQPSNERQEHFLTATSMYSQMQMQSWLQKAQAGSVN